MFGFDVYQQRQGATFLMPNGSVKEVETSLKWVGVVTALTGAEAIDKARDTLPAFKGWRPTRLEAYPVVEQNGLVQ